VATLNVFCAGAAQAVMMEIAAKFERETGNAIAANFGAVGAMKARVVAGEPADVIVLTAALIDELTTQNLAVAGTRVDLGKVGTGVAVRAGTPLPDVSNIQVLRGNLLAAKRVLFPDPAVATAGKVVMSALEKMGIAGELKSRLHFFPNGYAAMNDLAQSRGLYEMGITQITEVVANPGVTLVGPLPAEVQNIAVYSAGLAAHAADAELARDFIKRLTGFSAKPILSAAGFDIGS
jgi:molybdate transport system substrate-binding protein